MKVVIQAVSEASVSINAQVYNQIEHGYLLYVGFNIKDEKKDVDEIVTKLKKLRINKDENGKLNINGIDDKRSILSISQFTLYANTQKGNRPSFTDAKRPDAASELYDYFNSQLEQCGFPVKTGIFGADMNIMSINTGPLTIILENNQII